MCIRDRYFDLSIDYKGDYIYIAATNNFCGDLKKSDRGQMCIRDSLKIWNSIPPNNPENFKAYIGKITRNIALDIWKKNHTQKRNA